MPENCYVRIRGTTTGPYHSSKNSLETRSLKLTLWTSSFSAMFFTATLEWASIQTGNLRDSQTCAAAVIVVVLPVPGGPFKTTRIKV